jgi:hypothetical protein
MISEKYFGSRPASYSIILFSLRRKRASYVEVISKPTKRDTSRVIWARPPGIMAPKCILNVILKMIMSRNVGNSV